ncbi:MAG: FAD-binding protein [Bacteroidales bacterium]|nr:FAD-binding protein [Bacteroidales bacterium]
MDSEIFIVGGGLAGWRAAEAAVRGGASVTLAANGVGNTPDIHALNCPVLPEDSVDLFIEDTLASGKGGSDRALVETMCRESLALKDEFSFDGTVIRPLGCSVPRAVSIRHAIGAIAVSDIKKRLKDKVKVENRTVTPEEVLALRAANPGLKIIIATGGWCGKYDFSDNPRYLKGDGLLMAEALGAALKDVDEQHVQYEPTVRVEGPRRGIPVITTLLYEGARMLNLEGREFLGDARLNKDELSRAIFKEGGYAIFDLTGVPDEKILECKMDLSERLIKVAPAPHSSLGGIVIDTKCHALDGDGKIVPGLFACGEVTAGVHGLNRLGGNGGTAAMVFGTIAGREAALEVNKDKNQ